MASRLYRTTLPLFHAVAQALTRLGLARLAAPTWAGLTMLDAAPGGCN